jgi:hypothetical protein
MSKLLLSRAQMNSPRQGFDVTTRTKLPVSPPWWLVNDYKSEKIGEEVYKEHYLHHLDENILDIVKWLDSLPEKLPIIKETHHLVLKCFCPDGVFCHTHLLIDWLLIEFPERFERAIILPQPKEVIDIFKWVETDAERAPADIYTIVFKHSGIGKQNENDMLGLGEDVTSPLGFSQCTTGTYSSSSDPKANEHLGKRIRWDELPVAHRRHIIMRLKEGED